MEAEASSESVTSRRKGSVDAYEVVKHALIATRLNDSYPELTRTILAWYGTEDEVSRLAQVRKNGAGKQVIFTYEANVFLDVMKLALRCSLQSKELDKTNKQYYAHILMGTCMFNIANVADILTTSRTAVMMWGAQRPGTFPMDRLGGTFDIEALPLLMGWWETRMQQPNSEPDGWLLKKAKDTGVSFPTLARFIGLSIQATKKAVESAETRKGPRSDVVINIGIAAASRTTDDAGDAPASPEGHLAGGGESGPEVGEADFEADSLLAPPILVGDGDAFAPAAYRASEYEADAGDAGHGDAPEDGLHEGSEGGLRKREDRPHRGVHPFFE